MVSDFWFLFVILLLVLIIISTYLSETKNQALKNITNKYASFNIEVPKKTETQIFYFWLKESPKKKDYINGVYIFSDEKGVYIKPTAFNFWVKGMFIPKADLLPSGEMRSFLKKKQIYSIDSLGVNIAFSDVNIPR